MYSIPPHACVGKLGSLGEISKHLSTGNRGTNISSHWVNEKYFKTLIIIVPDRRRLILPEVILVRRWVTGVLGIWRGECLGKGLGQGRSVYKQPETEVDGSCHRERGLKGEQKGGKGESAMGDKSKGNAPCIVVCCNLCLCIYGMLEMIE
jgi:hypothetical protein